jgi:acyl-coenzyme A synthetase/AMP-(fatty) acid ligase
MAHHHVAAVAVVSVCHEVRGEARRAFATLRDRLWPTAEIRTALVGCFVERRMSGCGEVSPLPTNFQAIAKEGF